VNRLLVVRLGSLGDLVHTLPAVSALRQAYPSAEIDWLVDAVHRELLAHVPVISTVVPLRDRSIGAWIDARRTLRARKYDAAIDLQGLVKSAALARLSGAARVIGFARTALREPAAALFYTQTVEVDDGAHVIRKNVALAMAIGAADRAIEFPIAGGGSNAAGLVRARGLDRFVLINPGAAWPNKRWPPAFFGALAAWIQERFDLPSLVLWGPGEHDVAREVVAASAGAAVEAPQTTLTDLIALCRVARLMVSGDTGPTHIAAAVGTPIVALFGPTNPARNGPWDERDVTISRYAACDCHYQRRCRRSTGWCLGTITIAEVQAAVERRMRHVEAR
jgi:lipopolysaccharide heptosyltransferase I